jgi:hypothetical protein
MTMNQDEAEEKRRALIEKRAYEIYESRGGSHGFDREDWDQAEHEIDGNNGDDVLPVGDDDEVEENKGAAT